MGGGPSKSHSTRVFFWSERGLAAVGIGQIENVEMSVWLDATRNDDLPLGIDRTASLHGRIVDTDVCDLFTIDAYCPVSNSLRRNDLAIANR